MSKPKKKQVYSYLQKPIDTTQLPNLIIGNSPIKYEESAGNLGITFNNTLTWSKHISKASGRTYGLLRPLSTFQSFLPTQLRMQVPKPIMVPTPFYDVQIFGHSDTLDTPKLTVACNSIVPDVLNLPI